MRPLLFSRVWLASALLAAASGCVTLADLPPPKDDAGPPEEGDPGQIVTEDPEDPGNPEPDPREDDAEVESPEPEVDSGKLELDAGSGPKPGPELDSGSASCSGADCSDAGTEAGVEVDAEVCPYPVDWFLPVPANCRPPTPPTPPPPPFVECNVNADCGQNRYCVSNTCRDRFVCSSSAECSPGEGCVDGACRAQQVCQSNNQCPQNQLCVAGACAPRCTADNACIVYQGAGDRSVRQLATDENALYFSLSPVTVGWQERGYGQLWRMVPGQAPTLVSEQVGPNTNFAVQNGYAYFRRGATFMRSRVEPDAPDQTLYAAPTPETASWAIGANFVVFSGYDGFWVGNLEGTMSLHNVPQDPGNPKDVMATADRFYFVAKITTPDHWLFSRITSVRAVEPYRLEDASPLFLSDYATIQGVRAPYAYLSWWSNSPMRVNLIDGSLEYLPDSTQFANSHALIGDWLYRFEELRDSTYESIRSQRVTRHGINDWTRKQEVVPLRLASASSAGNLMAVLGNRFYSAKSRADIMMPSIIYEMALPAAP